MAGVVPLTSTSSGSKVKAVNGQNKYKTVQVSLKDVRPGIVHGRKVSHTLHSVCAMAQPPVDIYVPPNTSFQGIKFLETITFLHKSLPVVLTLSSLPKWNAPGPSPSGIFTIDMKGWSHIDKRHVIEYDLSNHMTYITARKSPSYLKSRGISVYIHPTVVFPLMQATLSHYDQIIHDPIRQNYSFLKPFSSEVGHAPNGACCYINKVVAAATPGRRSYHVVTAYPVTDFV